MQKQVLVPLGLVVVGILALSCAPADPESNVAAGDAGDAADSAAADGAWSGSGDAAPGGGADATVTGDTGPIATADSGAMPTGDADAAAAGDADAAATGDADAAATSDGGAMPTGDAGATGGMGGSGDYWGGLKNPPRKSAGCGKPAMITNGKKTITSGGRDRAYIIDIPANYDANKPYRLFYASHGLGGRAEDVAGWNYFDLKTQAAAAKEPAVFIAPQGIDNRWGEVDHALFDDITNFAKDSLCIDTTRVFVTGMSFGGMITYSLSTNHQKRFRAGVGLAPVNYVIWLPNPKLKEPIAWMQRKARSSSPWRKPPTMGARCRPRSPRGNRASTFATTWRDVGPAILSRPARSTAATIKATRIPAPTRTGLRKSLGNSSRSSDGRDVFVRARAELARPRW
jgi:hypothetical protein